MSTADVEPGMNIELEPIPSQEAKRLSATLKSLHTSFTQTIEKIYPEEKEVPFEVQRLQDSLDGAVWQAKRLRPERCATHSLEHVHGILPEPEL
jgi:hypothetical protein